MLRLACHRGTEDLLRTKDLACSVWLVGLRRSNNVLCLGWFIFNVHDIVAGTHAAFAHTAFTHSTTAGVTSSGTRITATAGIRAAGITSATRVTTNV